MRAKHELMKPPFSEKGKFDIRSNTNVNYAIHWLVGIMLKLQTVKK